MFENMAQKNDIKTLADITSNNEIIRQIFDKGTYGKSGKINRFVKSDDLKEISDNVILFLNSIKTAQKPNQQLFKDGKINSELIKEVTRKTNMKNAVFLASGLVMSILGLAVIIPKTAFWITKKLTGKNEFSGLMSVDDNSNS